MNKFIFHLAFPIANISDTKQFYVAGLGCAVGRETANSIILNLYGHQLVGHVTESIEAQSGIYPRHFGIVLIELADWEAIRDRAQGQSLTFYQQPKHRFPGEITEHRTFFLVDLCGNLLEFKYYVHTEAIFGARDFDLIGDVK
jgi:extradiol dioxygenase family protein